MNDLPEKLLEHLIAAESTEAQQKLVRQALEYFKDTRDPTLVQQAKQEASQHVSNQETAEMKRLREENNILRKGVRALSKKNNDWCKTTEALKERDNDIKNLQFKIMLLQ